MGETFGKVLVSFFAVVVAVRGRGQGHKPDYVRYLDDFRNSAGDFGRCQEDLNRWWNASHQGEKWAYQMLDASTKLPVGLLTGNLVDYGNYDECINVMEGPPTQHCLATLQIPQPPADNSSSPSSPIVFRWSYCLPESCPPEVLETALENLLGELIGDVNVTVLPSNCQTGAGKAVSAADAMGISIWTGIAVVALASTIYHVTCAKIKTEPNPWLTTFSIWANLRRLMNTQVTADNLTPLNGIRFLSIAWIVLGHRYFFASTSSVMNLINVIEEFEEPYFQIFVGGVHAVDTFFLLSGLLNSYLLLKVMNKTKKFPVIKFYVHRYLRTTPALAAVALMYSTWFVLIGNGPAWDQTTSQSKQLCVDYWWSTLLYINNYYNPVNQCVGQSWYLAVDMQLYWLSPFIILPIWKWPKIAKWLLSGLVLASTASQFYVAYVNKFRMAFSLFFDSSGVEESQKVFELLYAPTHTRATPYLIGIALGVYLDSIRNRPTKPKWPKIVVIFGWLLSATVCLSVLFGNYPFFRSPKNHPYNRMESSIYIALHRLSWSAGIGWVILACLFGYGGVVNSILSWRFFVPLNRLTYCIFLTHMAVQQYQLGTARTIDYYQMFDEIHQYFGDLLASVFTALVLTLLFESPVMSLEKMVLGRGREATSQHMESYTNKAFQDT